MPPPETVTDPLLDDVAVFWVAERVKLPLFVPLFAVIFNHAGLLTVHETFDVTETVLPVPPAAGIFDHSVAGDIASDADRVALVTVLLATDVPDEFLALT